MGGSAASIGRIALIGVGAVIGGALGVPGVGAAIGGALGGLLFPERLPGVSGPRLNDVEVTTSTEGQAIPLVYGSHVVAGNIIWAAPLREVKNTEEQGGKGGPTQEVTTYTYFLSFALALCEGDIGGVRRIWANGKIIYDRRPQQDGESNADYTARLAASDELDERMTTYLGTEGQEPDSVIEATEGVGNVPGHRGLAYLVFEDYDVTDLGGRPPTFKVEVVKQFPDIEQTDFTQYSNYVLYPWEEDSADPRACRNLHEYRYAGTGDWYATLEEALAEAEADLGYAIPDTIIGWGKSGSDQIYPFHTDISPDEAEVLLLHFNQYFASVPEDRFFATLTEGATDSPCGTFLANGITPGDDFFYWTKRYADDTFSTNIFCIPGVYLFSEVAPGPVYTPPLLAAPDSFGNCTNYPSNGGFFPAYSARQDTLIQVRRKIRAPADPCLPHCEPPYPDYPSDSTYCLIGETAVKRGDWTLTAGDFKAIAIYSVDAVPNPDEVQQYPLNPVLPSTDPNYSDEEYWTNQYNAKVLLGDVPAGWTYSTTGLGGYGTFPRYMAEAFVRTATTLTITYPDTDGVRLSDIVSDLCDRSGLEAEDYDTTELTEIVYGYKIERVMSARDAIEPLRAFGFFDGVESEGQIKFPLRGKAVVATLDADTLGASADGNSPALVELQRTEDIELPRIVRVRYANVAAEYQAGEQKNQRLITDAVGAVDLELVIAMTDDKAAQIAEVLMGEAWVGREAYTCKASPGLLYLEPGDAINLPVEGEMQRVRIASITEGLPGVLQIEALRDDPSVYESTAAGVASGIVEQTVEIVGDTTMVIIDGPALIEAHDEPGLYLACRGEGSGWNGCGVFQSIDGGANFSRVLTVNGASTMGTLDDALPAGPYEIWDDANTLTVTLDSGTLESRTDEAVLNGANGAFIGADDRWELIQFGTATLVAEGVYELSHLLRGRRGTECYVGTSEAGDTFVLASTLRRLTLPESAIGITRHYKAVSFGKLTESAAEQQFTTAGVALECYAPTQVSMSKDVSGNLNITWNRRARLGPEWVDGADVPLSEASEQYEIEILDVPGSNVVLRTLEATTNNVQYTSAQQVSDFGSTQPEVSVRVFQLSANTGRGFGSDCSVSAELPVGPVEDGGSGAGDTPGGASEEENIPGTATITYGPMVPKVWDGARFVAQRMHTDTTTGGQRTYTWTSADGQTWTQRAGEIGVGYGNMAYGGGLYVLILGNWFCVTADLDSAWTANKIGTWPDRNVGGGLPFSRPIYDGSQFISASTNGLVVVSADGETWTEVGTESIPATDYVGQIAYDGSSVYIASVKASASEIYLSSDLETWGEQAYTADANNPFGYPLFGPYTGPGRAYYVNGKFFIVGSKYSASATTVPMLLRSDDGATWAEVTFSGAALGLSILTEIVYFDSKWIVFGLGGSAYSSDLSTWTTDTSDGQRSGPVASSGVILCTQADGLARSTDGITWTPVTF